MQVDSLPAEPPGKPKNTGVGSLSLLQGIFQAQESNLGLPHCRCILYQLSHQGSRHTFYKVYLRLWAHPFKRLGSFPKSTGRFCHFTLPPTICERICPPNTHRTGYYHLNISPRVVGKIIRVKICTSLTSIEVKPLSFMYCLFVFSDVLICFLKLSGIVSH